MSKKSDNGWLGLGALALSLLACSLTNPTPAAWVLTPTAEAEAALATSAAQTRAANTAPNNFAATETPTNPTFPTQTPQSNNLNSAGPWLVYSTEAGRALIVRNADGSGQTRLALPDPLLDPGDLVNGLNPQGGWLAVRTGRKEGWADLAIQLIHLPDGAMQRLTPLLSPDLQNNNLVVQSVVWRDALRWSPDGHTLAFIAATEGSSSDLYVYDNTAHTIQRVTTGSYQAGTPSWSPDSQWVVTQEMSAITGSGPTGWKLEEVWAVNLATQEFRKLYEPSTDSDGEIFLGWASPTKLLFYSHNLSGWHDLRQIDIEKLKITPLLTGAFSQIAFDPTGMVTLYALKEGPSLAAGASPGLYQISAEGEAPVLIQAGEWPQLSWSTQAAAFLASGQQGMLVVQPQGSPQLYKNEPSCQPSPNGKWLACWGGAGAGSFIGLRLYQPGAGFLQSILPDAVLDVTWVPDTTGLFALSNGHLYHFTFPDLKPSILEDTIQPTAGATMLWVAAEHP